MRLLLSTLLIILLTATIPCEARRIRTNNGKSKARTTLSAKSTGKRGSTAADSPAINENPAVNDYKEVVTGYELEPYISQVEFSGYDKTATSNKETVCITNNTAQTLYSSQLEITYLDMQGRMLHKRSVDIRTEIPAGETRTVSFRHYDAQQSLYYHRSKPPRTHGIPYDIRISLLSLTL